MESALTAFKSITTSIVLTLITFAMIPLTFTALWMTGRFWQQQQWPQFLFLTPGIVAVLAFGAAVGISVFDGAVRRRRHQPNTQPSSSQLRHSWSFRRGAVVNAAGTAAWVYLAFTLLCIVHAVPPTSRH